MSTVVLDIGAGVGALVLYTLAAMDGWEIEVSRDGEKRTHSQVHRRDTGDYAAVFPSLPAGDYAIWRADGEQATTITITGGSVTNCRWPG
jgi:hypothetical protein